jgi:hypothetical protein
MERCFAQVWAPVVVEVNEVLRFGDPRVQALPSVLVIFRLLPDGFANRDLRVHLAPLLGVDLPSMTAGGVTRHHHGTLTLPPRAWDSHNGNVPIRAGQP